MVSGPDFTGVRVPRLTRHGVTWPDGGESLATLTADFRRQQCVRLPSLLDPWLVGWVQRAIERGRFHDKAHGDAATAQCLRLGDTLEHRVTALDGTRPKTACAGWFRREPDYLHQLRSGAAAGGA